MTTTKQRKATQNLVENGGNIGKAMVEAGYSPATAKTPQKLTESKGYKEFLEKSGLTKDLVVSALVQDIENKPSHRIQELRLASDMLGLSKPQEEPEEQEQVLVVMKGNKDD